MRNKIKKIYGSQFEFCELPLHKQEETMENAQHDLKMIKSILNETRKGKVFSNMKNKD